MFIVLIFYLQTKYFFLIWLCGFYLCQGQVRTMLTLCYIHHKTSSNSNIILVFNSYPGFPAELLLLCNVSRSFSFIVRNFSSSRIICPTSKQKINHANIKIQIKILIRSSKKRKLLEKITKNEKLQEQTLSDHRSSSLLSSYSISRKKSLSPAAAG